MSFIYYILKVLSCIFEFFSLFQDQHGVSPNRSFDGSSGLSGLGSPLNGQPNGPIDPPMLNNNLPVFNGK